MKNINLLIWLTQFGLSVAVPFAGFTFIGVWLYQRFNLGIWVILAGIAMGLISAVGGFKNGLKAMERMAKNPKEKKAPVSFNDHI